MSENIHLTVDIVKKFPDFNWDWKKISNILCGDCEKWLKEFPNKPWDWKIVVGRLYYKIDIFKKKKIPVEKYIKCLSPTFSTSY